MSPLQRLYFCRHGESELNRRRIFAGQLDTPLTAHGREQATQAGRQAAAFHIDTIVSSPLRRARETAQIIADAIGYPTDKIIMNAIFMERSLGSLEGKSWDDYVETATATNGVETDTALLVRVQQGLALLHQVPGPNILLVGHGSFSRALCTAIDPTRSYDEPPNAEILRFI